MVNSIGPFNLVQPKNKVPKAYIVTKQNLKECNLCHGKYSTKQSFYAHTKRGICDKRKTTEPNLFKERHNKPIVANIICKCGATIKKSQIKRHLATKGHIKRAEVTLRGTDPIKQYKEWDKKVSSIYQSLNASSTRIKVSDKLLTKLLKPPNKEVAKIIDRQFNRANFNLRNLIK